nr:MAG TPA: hypothetical protein [Caudoviricetes sp.]
MHHLKISYIFLCYLVLQWYNVSKLQRRMGLWL